jgi:acyl-CoA hydrolase
MADHEQECRTVEQTRVTLARIMHPMDANPAGNVHGGTIMKFIDDAAGSVAMRHARSNAVTASIDRLDFHEPVYVGDLLTLKASMNCVGRTSMEVGVRVEAEDLHTGTVRHTASAYLTFVSLGANGKPRVVPGLTLVTAEDRRRWDEALARREERQHAVARKRSHKKGA